MSSILAGITENSVIKGIVDEGEEVAVIYIDGKPSAKYAKKHEAERDAEFMRSRHPDKKIEIKQEVRETEAKKGADGKRCWKGKRYAGTENGKDKCIPVKNEAANPAQQAAIAIAKKKKAKTNEGVIVGHDANDPEVAILGGAGTMSLSRLKKKAQGEAEQLANDLVRGRFKAAAYNIKQLENTLKTIVAAEDEMEKGYFGESIEELNEGWKMGTLGTIAGIVFGPSVAASMFGDIGDHNGVNHLLTVLGSMIAGGYFGKDISSVRDLIDRFTKNPVEFRKMIKQRNAEKKKNKRASEKSSAISVLKGVISQIDLVIQAINNKQYKKAANIFSSGDLNPGMLGLFPNLVYALENLSDMEETTLVISEIRYALDVYEKFKTSPNDYAPEFIQALGEFKQYLMNRIREAQIDEDYTGEFAAEKTCETNPYGGQEDRQFRGAISETPTDNPTGTSTEGGWRRTDLDEYREMSPALKAAQQNLIALRNKEKATSVPGKRERAPRDRVELDKPKPASVLTKGAQEVDPDTMDAIAAFLAKGGEIKKGRPGKAPPTGRQQASKHIGGGGKYRKKSDTPGQGANYRGAAIVAVEEDTAYAGGMGQGGNAGQSYRKFKPKSAGTFKEEEQLDEKCWDTHKQVGMKKKGDKMVPNCVPKESAIMKGLKR